jgi:tRNA threonylcarbamoyladenosine biosynthesis protein TsaB
MLLLAADTAGKNGSIALVRVPDARQAEPIEVLEVIPLAGGTFSAQLIPQTAVLLEKHGGKKEDIVGFAVVSGPGSFTGLRVGLAAIKALGEITGKPIAAVSLLEATAVSAGESGKLAAVLDAGRGDLYVGEYEVAEGQARTLNERLLTLEECFLAAAGCLLVTPDDTIAATARARGVAVKQIEPPRSDLIAQLGWKKILAGETVAPDALEANYIRRSDAEIFSKPKV